MIPIWMYWEGPMPEHISLCIKSVQQTAAPCEMILVTPDNMSRYIPPKTLHSNFEILKSPEKRADCIRAALIHLYGGFYYDADTIGLQSPENLASEHDLVYCIWDRPPKRVLNGYLYAKACSNVAGQWLDGINRRLNEFKVGIKYEWAFFGEKILTELVKANPTTTRQIPRTTFLPIDIDSSVKTFFSRNHPKIFIKPETVCFGLNHSWMMKNQRNLMLMPPRQMASSPLLIHRLFTKARKELAGNQ